MWLMSLKKGNLDTNRSRDGSNAAAAAADAKSLQSCPTLWDPIVSSPPGSPIPGILQAKTLEWVAISFSSAWKWKVKVKSLSRVQLLVTPWTAAYQASPSMGFARQEYWSGLPLLLQLNIYQYSCMSLYGYTCLYFFEVNYREEWQDYIVSIHLTF